MRNDQVAMLPEHGLKVPRKGHVFASQDLLRQFL